MYRTPKGIIFISATDFVESSCITTKRLDKSIKQYKTTHNASDPRFAMVLLQALDCKHHALTFTFCWNDGFMGREVHIDFKVLVQLANIFNKDMGAKGARVILELLWERDAVLETGDIVDILGMAGRMREETSAAMDPLSLRYCGFFQRLFKEMDSLPQQNQDTIHIYFGTEARVNHVYHLHDLFLQKLHSFEWGL